MSDGTTPPDWDLQDEDTIKIDGALYDAVTFDCDKPCGECHLGYATEACDAAHCTPDWRQDERDIIWKRRETP